MSSSFWLPAPTLDMVTEPGANRSRGEVMTLTHYQYGCPQVIGLSGSGWPVCGDHYRVGVASVFASAQ